MAFKSAYFIISSQPVKISNIKMAQSKALSTFSHDESNIQVLIKIFSCNKTISLEVKPSDTIQKIKSIIREEEEIPEHQQFDLILAGEKLDDDKTLSDCQILNGTTLNLIRWFAIDHFELK